MLAGVAEGTYASLDEAADGLVELGATYERTPAPRPPTTRHTSLGGPASTRARLRSHGGYRRKAGGDPAGPADPTDLAGLREALALRRPRREARPIGMSRIEIGGDALPLARGRLGVRPWRPRRRASCLVMDATPMRRNDGDPKDEAERVLAQQFEVQRVVLGEGRGAQLHADEEVLAEARTAVSPTAWWWLVRHRHRRLQGGYGGRAAARGRAAASVNAFHDVSVLSRAGPSGPSFALARRPHRRPEDAGRRATRHEPRGLWRHHLHVECPADWYLALPSAWTSLTTRPRWRCLPGPI